MTYQQQQTLDWLQWNAERAERNGYVLTARIWQGRLRQARARFAQENER